MSKRAFTALSRGPWLCSRCSARSRTLSSLSTARRPFLKSRQIQTQSTQSRYYSDKPTPPTLPAALQAALDEYVPSATTLLSKMRADLKTAMREKNQAALSVLREVLADLKNAEKGNAKDDAETDLAIRSMLQKKMGAAREAAEGFEGAGRTDLADKEKKQVEVMQAYVDTVRVVPRETIEKVVQSVVGTFEEDGRAPNVGSLMQALVGKEGFFQGRNVDRSVVSEVLQDFVPKKK